MSKDTNTTKMPHDGGEKKQQDGRTAKYVPKSSGSNGGQKKPQAETAQYAPRKKNEAQGETKNYPARSGSTARKRSVPSNGDGLPLKVKGGKKLSEITETKNKNKKKKEKVLKEHSKNALDLRKNFVLVAIMLMFAFLITVLYSLMIIDEKGLSQKASEQYTRELTLPAKRGTIYDRNMNVLAMDYTVYEIFISPRDIKTQIQRKLVIDGLVDILGVDREMVEERADKKNTMYQVIAKNVEEEKATELRTYISKVLARTRSYENPNGINLSNIINLTEGTKRYYPYGSLASNVIGFVSGSSTSTTDVGVCGVEATYEKVLKGVNGKIVRAADGQGGDIAYKFETYIEAQNGKNIVLSIDITIQAVLEKYLEEAYYDNNKPTNGVAGVIMDVNTGEILASAKYPSFNLNEPRVLNVISQAKYDGMSFAEKSSYLIGKVGKEEFAKLTEEQIETYSHLYMCMDQWSDKVVMETYEPGSTFKIITAAVALEEGVANLNDTFVCTSKPITVGGWPIHCHKSGGHGLQNFGQTLQNSCNPAFVTWGLDIGKTKFVDYYEAFGYTDKTGCDMYAESFTVYFGNSPGAQFEETELAVYSFGQTFRTTMIQQIRGVSTVANGGTLVTPHVGVGTCDINGNMTEEYTFKSTLQVISESTSNEILKILEEGSTMGTTKNATVPGYSIAAKTGTSQKRDIKDEELYIGSCVAFAPAEDPQIAVLIAIDEPRGPDFYGGVIAAPVVSKVLTEVLPYLEIPRSDENAPESVTVGDYRDNSVEEAKQKIDALGLSCRVIGMGSTVVEQMPRMGEKVTNGGTVILYTENAGTEEVVVPNLLGKTPESVNKILLNSELNLHLTGAYNSDSDEAPVAISQSVEAGTTVPKGTVIEVEFFYKGIVG